MQMEFDAHNPSTMRQRLVVGHCNASGRKDFPLTPALFLQQSQVRSVDLSWAEGASGKTSSPARLRVSPLASGRCGESCVTKCDFVHSHPFAKHWSYFGWLHTYEHADSLPGVEEYETSPQWMLEAA